MFKHKLKPGRIFLAAFLIFTQSAFCVPSPWSAWRYEHTVQFKYFPQAWNLPKIAEFPTLFVDGAFVYVFIRAHNKSTHSGKPPYMLIASTETTNKTHTSVTFHSITIESSLHKKHRVLPITVNAAARKTAVLEFPVNKEFKFRNFAQTSNAYQKYMAASLWSDETLQFKPKKGEIIKIIIDVETHANQKSTRQKVEYEFVPSKESGMIQCITA